jgi:pimeloyl-ACP methyl ester carboxylesterase
MQRLEAGGLGLAAGAWPPDPGLPTVVFVHGSGGSGALWDAQIRGLAGIANALAPDLPGHGASAGEGIRDVGAYARAVDSFVDAVGTGSAILCGHSLGGAIVLRLLIDHPSRYAAGILVNSGARLRVSPLILEAIRNDYEAFLAGMYSMGASEKTDPKRVRAAVNAMRACPPEVTLGDFKACDAFDVMEELGRIEVPVLVLTASDDRLTPPKYGTFLAGAIERSTLVQVEDAGHLSPVEKPEEITGAIASFVASL